MAVFRGITMRMKSECIGITNHNPKTGERGAKCESKVKVKGCEEPDNGLCWMHCDCSFCGTKHYTKNQGVVHPDVCLSILSAKKDCKESRFKGWGKDQFKELDLELELNYGAFFTKCVDKVNKRFNKEKIEKIKYLQREIDYLKSQQIGGPAGI